MSRKLPNYLRTYRKRSGFTQDEMAFLLGCRSGAKVSRYEHNKRQPNPQSVFAYNVIFQVPTEELFAGIYQQVERNTLKRIKSLTRRLEKAQPNPLTTRKVEILKRIPSAKSKNS